MAVGDAAILMSIYWLNPQRMRGVTTALFTILAIFMYANVLYTRYWGDIIPFAVIFSKASYNSLVLQSISSLFWKRDVVYLIFVVGVIILWYNNRNSHKFRTAISTRLIAITSIIALFIGCILLSTYQIYHNNAKRGQTTTTHNTYADILNERFNGATQCCLFTELQRQGLFIYLIRNITQTVVPHKIKLGSTELHHIAKFTQARLHISNGLQLNGNQHKNLIFIIVESMNAPYISRVVGGEDITPVISSLLAQPGTIYALNIKPQIIAGGSSDGQLIYNTGLLPISDDCTAWKFGNNTFHSLAKSLNREQSIEIISDEVSVWNHATTSKAYGYDGIFDSYDITKAGIQINQVGGDAALFSYSMAKLKKLKQPFFAELTTISMHFPFKNSQAQFSNRITQEMIPDEIERRYCESIHYFDTQLGQFLSELSKAGLTDNSVIILASDHAQATTQSNIEGHSYNQYPIAFIAINTGTTMHVDRPIHQADIYPTILDIMGVAPKDWRGVGHSIFVQNPPDDEQLQFELSDKIIRSDYIHTIATE
jgi:phosphoglycerol transferase MdoB-like AlkP superfamily enzyme